MIYKTEKFSVIISSFRYYEMLSIIMRTKGQLPLLLRIVELGFEILWKEQRVQVIQGDELHKSCRVS